MLLQRRLIIGKDAKAYASVSVDILCSAPYTVFKVVKQSNGDPLFYDTEYGPFPYYDDKTPIGTGDEYEQITCELETGEWYTTKTSYGYTSAGMYSIYRDSGEEYEYEGEYNDWTPEWETTAVLFYVTPDLHGVSSYSK